MADTQEFLEDGVMSLVLQFTDKLPLKATEIGYEVIAEQQQMLVRAILQHFQQEQEIVTILAESETGVAATNATERAVWKETKPDTFEFSHIEEQKLYTQSEVDRLIREAREREAYWSLANLELIKGGTFNEGMVYKNQLDRLKVISEELPKQEEGSK